jgi:hypothetical protein
MWTKKHAAKNQKKGALGADGGVEHDGVGLWNGSILNF